VEPAGVVDRRVVVPPSGLEQEDARAAVHEAPRDDRAGRPGTHHDDVDRALAHGWTLERARGACQANSRPRVCTFESVSARYCTFVLE